MWGPLHQTLSFSGTCHKLVGKRGAVDPGPQDLAEVCLSVRAITYKDVGTWWPSQANPSMVVLWTWASWAPSSYPHQPSCASCHRSFRIHSPTSAHPVRGATSPPNMTCQKDPACRSMCPSLLCLSSPYFPCFRKGPKQKQDSINSRYILFSCLLSCHIMFCFGICKEYGIKMFFQVEVLPKSGLENVKSILFSKFSNFINFFLMT